MLRKESAESQRGGDGNCNLEVTMLSLGVRHSARVSVARRSIIARMLSRAVRNLSSIFSRGIEGSELAGSGIGQCSRRALPRNKGHTSSAQRVITVPTVAGSIVSTDFEYWAPMSTPSSAHHLDGIGVYLRRCAPRALHRDPVPEDHPPESFRHLASGGVCDAKEQDALGVVGHGLRLSCQGGTGFAQGREQGQRRAGLEGRSSFGPIARRSRGR